MEVNIIGCNYSDTVLYLVRVLQWFGKSVLIRDFTKNKSLSASIPCLEGIDVAKDIYDYYGVGYTFSLKEDSGYDTFFRLYDADMIPFVTGATIIITDESRGPLSELNKLKWNEYCEDGRDICLIIKNYTGYVRKEFDELIKHAGIGNYYQIPVDVCNFKAAVLTEYMDHYKFTGISKYYKEAIAGSIKVILKEKNYKEIDYAIKNAAGGKRKK